MLNPEEQKRLLNIKARVKDNAEITPSEKQWVINMHIKARKPVAYHLVLAAMQQGFQVGGLTLVGA